MSKRKASVRFYKDMRGQWRWRLTAPNGKIIAASSEAYRHKQGCCANWDAVCEYICDGRYEEVGR